MKWYDISERAQQLRPFNFIIGGRGIGKTYSTISWLIEKGEPFLYLRNTDTQMTESCSAFGNPFKRWSLDHGRDIFIQAEGKHYIIKERTGEKTGRILGYAAALSVFENLRGVDLSECKYVMFDEFIERRTLMFDQFSAFANFYETVNRNRELLGDPPLMCFLLSNAQKLDNAILAGYNIIPIIEDMLRSGQRSYTNDLLHIELPKSEVSAAKMQTVNYLMTEGSSYYQEAISNDFAFDSFYNVGKKPIKEYIPVCMIDNMFIYQHKSNNNYYICRTANNKVRDFTSKDNLRTFLQQYGLRLRIARDAGKLEYADYSIKSKFSALLR